MNFIFLMDPLETVIYEKDTSFILMVGARERGHSIYFVTDGGLAIKNNRLTFKAQQVVPQRVPSKPFIIKKSVELTADQVDCVFVRSDPPFDQQYLINTLLLDQLPGHIPVINRPSGLRAVNEKIWAARFKNFTPRTLVGRNRRDLLTFIAKEKKVIAKPTDGHGGSGVFYVQQDDKNTNVILETLTGNFTKDIILQQYLPAAQKGDKRILLLNGDPLGAVLRVHAKDDHRNNFFSGGKPVSATITKRDHQIIELLRPELQRLGLYFVGIDVIGEHLTEVNVTSPTCLQEMNRLYGKKLEGRVIEFAEQLVGRFRLEYPVQQKRK